MEYFVNEQTFTQPGNMRLATGPDYGILLVQRGMAAISGRQLWWKAGTEDLLVCKPGQVLNLEFPGGRYPLSVLWVSISPELMARYSGEKTDVPAGFSVNPEPVVLIRAGSEILMLIKSLALQMVSLPKQREEYASDLLEEGTLKVFLALVLRACASQDHHRLRSGSHLALDEVFHYIHSHLTEEITLEQLEREFYVSRHHLIREFKKHTGQTVHRYIVNARLDLCRKYIEQGYSITEVYRMGGFGGYNHFFRAFKQAYGMTPKEYARSLQTRDGE